jgi:hypothetical protein
MAHYPLDFELDCPRGSAVVLSTGVPDGAGGWIGSLRAWQDGHLLLASEASVAAQVHNAAGTAVVPPSAATYGGPGWWWYALPATLFDGTQGDLDAFLLCYAADSVTLERTFHGKLYDRGG